MNYQAPQIEWQEPKNNEVIYDNNYQNDVICFWHNPINSYFIRKNPDEKSPKPFIVAYGGRELKEMASVADAKEWVEQTHYPSALAKAGFKPASEPLSDTQPVDAVEHLTLIEKLEKEKNNWHDDGENNVHRVIDDCIDIVKQHEAEARCKMTDITITPEEFQDLIIYSD